MIQLSALLEAARARESDQEYLVTLEGQAVAYAQKRLGFYIGAEEEVTEYLEGTGTSRLWLPDNVATAPTSVIERTSPGAASSTTITESASDGFVVRGRKLIRKARLAWHLGYEYEVAYTRGYAEGEEPEVVRSIVTDLVLHWFERRIPMPKIGEVHTFPVPHHLDSKIQAARRQRV